MELRGCQIFTHVQGSGFRRTVRGGGSILPSCSKKHADPDFDEQPVTSTPGPLSTVGLESFSKVSFLPSPYRRFVRNEGNIIPTKNPI